jgi:hypothetical protein
MPPPRDNIALPTLSTTKERVHVPHPAQDQSSMDHRAHSEPDDRGEYESSGDTSSTNTSDEFNWDDEEEQVEAAQDTKAKRGRALYLAFMKLARPFRVILIGFLGAGILITPLLVVQLKFKSSVVRPQVHMWSLWLSIIWASSCITYLVVDAIPRLVIATIVLFGGHVERLNIQLEVCRTVLFVNLVLMCGATQLIPAVSGWLKLELDISWAWIALGILQTYYLPNGNYWAIVNRVMQVRVILSLRNAKKIEH